MVCLTSEISAKQLKASVICPTYDRPDKHPNLYQAFAWQTYENRELLIYDDSLEPSIFFLNLKDARVKYFHSPERVSIGFKRNFLVEKALGEIIAHFDDDDYYSPNYLSEMIDKLGEADLIKLSKWLTWREFDGSLWEWDTRFISNLHFLVPSDNRSSNMIDIHAIAERDPNLNKSEWINANMWGFGFSYVYKKSLWKDCLFEDSSAAEDYRFILKAKALGKKLIHIPDINGLVIHTLHAKSTSKIFPQCQSSVSLLEERTKPWLITHIKPKVINKELLNEVVQPFWIHDSHLKSFVERHCFDPYEICYVENRDAYYVEKDTSDLIKSRFIKNGIFWEKHIYDQFQKYVKPGSTVIDVGGHIGTHTLALSRLVGSRGVVHVFEPQAKVFSELLLNMHLNNCSNIIFHRVALGDKKQVVEMNPIDISNEGNTSVGMGGDKVQMERLDDLQLANVSLIKIDAEGYEDKVIEGALKMIRSQKPVLIIEMWSDSELKQKIQKMEKLGYQAFNLSGVHDYLFIPIHQK